MELAREITYCRRHRETLPCGDLGERTDAATKDQASVALVSGGLAYLAEILALLHVALATPRCGRLM
jgi:hypothetical protein